MKSFTLFSKEVENQYTRHDHSIWKKRQNFTFARSKRFSPKFNLPVRENNLLEQAAFWHKVKVVSCLPNPLFCTMKAQFIITDQLSIVCCFCCCCCFNLIFALFLFLFISRYLKKSVHGPGPWQGVHGPGPPKWSMDPWSMFCPHPFEQLGPGPRLALNPGLKLYPAGEGGN